MYDAASYVYVHCTVHNNRQLIVVQRYLVAVADAVAVLQPEAAAPHRIGALGFCLRQLGNAHRKIKQLFTVHVIHVRSR